tara:strand:+ start:563 stop:1168 length:606 start_codon:yes stop_codon:yes gene_type:complete
VLEGEPMALPSSLRELNDRVTKAGEDLKETYNQLRRGGAPGTSKPTSSDNDGGIPGISGDPRFVPTQPFGDPRFKPTEPFKKTAVPTQDVQEMIEVTPQEALEIVVNEPAIRITPELMEVINDPSMMMTRSGELTRRMTNNLSRQFELQNVLPGKKKRKVSKYQKEFGRQLKILKKKFPRTKIQNLMKRAHAATRKALKKK